MLCTLTVSETVRDKLKQAYDLPRNPGEMAPSADDFHADSDEDTGVPSETNSAPPDAQPDSPLEGLNLRRNPYHVRISFICIYACIYQFILIDLFW